MKKILVTGSAGFIGSRLVEKCVEAGFSVRAFIRYNSRGNWGWLEHSPCRKEFEVVSGDIRDHDSVLHAMQGCQGVFHLAALIGIPYSYESPLAYIKTNVEGTYNILDSARIAGMEDIVVTSTSETYGTAQYVPIDEKHPSIGQSPYAASKIAADQLAVSYHRSFGLPVKIVRPFNTYGPRQSARAFIPSVIIQLLEKKRKKLQTGNLYPTRDLTYVDDTVAAFIEVFRCDRLVGETVNVGMNEEISMADLARKIQELIGTDLPLEEDRERVRPDASEVERLRCDNKKILSITGWKPQYDLSEGLKATIAWIEKSIGLYKPDQYHV